MRLSLSPPLHPAVEVQSESLPSRFALRCPSRRGIEGDPKEALPAGPEVNSKGLTLQREQKPVEACARATPFTAPFFTVRRFFGCLETARRGETAKIYHLKLVSSFFSSFLVGELSGRLVFAPCELYRAARSRSRLEFFKLKIDKS